MKPHSFCKSSRNNFLRLCCVIFAYPEFYAAQGVGIQPIDIYCVIVRGEDWYLERFEKRPDDVGLIGHGIYADGYLSKLFYLHRYIGEMP